MADHDKQAKEAASGVGDSGMLDASETTVADVCDLHMSQLQEQLIATMIENENIKAELLQFKERNRVDEIVRALEVEREKNERLALQLQQQSAHIMEMTKANIIPPADLPSDVSDDEGQSSETPHEKQSWVTSVRNYFVRAYAELMSDLTVVEVETTQRDPEGDQLTVKQLKENIKRFKNAIGPIFRFCKGVHSIFTYKSPGFSLLLFMVYMYSVWCGWLLPVILLLCVVRLFLNSLNACGWKIDIHFVTYPEVLEEKSSEGERALSDKFNLVLQVARQVQNVLGELADGLEKIKNLFLWRHPSTSRQLLLSMVVGFILSCIMSGVALFRLIALYLGIKMFVIEYFYDRFPRFKQRHDSVYRIWKQLPTDAMLEDQYKRSLVDRHIIIASKDNGSDEPNLESNVLNSEITEDDRSFCDVFSLPLSERPLPGWEGGYRVSLVDKERPLIKTLSRSGRMYLTNSFLCIERFKFKSPKNIMIPLTNITGVEKVKPFSWMPGAGMSIQIAVTGYDQPYTFGAIINRDECFKLLVTHGARLQLSWATQHSSVLVAGSRSQSPNPDGSPVDNSPPASAKAERSFRMSDLRDDFDDDDKLVMLSGT